MPLLTCERTCCHKVSLEQYDTSGTFISALKKNYGEDRTPRNMYDISSGIRYILPIFKEIWARIGALSQNRWIFDPVVTWLTVYANLCQSQTQQTFLERERIFLFNDALYLRLYGVRHMVKDNSDSEKGNPLPPHRLLLSINSKGSFICTIPETR